MTIAMIYIARTTAAITMAIAQILFPRAHIQAAVTTTTVQVVQVVRVVHQVIALGHIAFS